MRNSLDEVVVACRNETCAFVGCYKEYKTHSCPLEVGHITDLEKLYYIINCDERLFVKMRVFEVFAERVINQRNGDINEDYLSIIYACLEKFDLYIEILHMCIDMISRVMETPGGIDHVRKCCTGIEECMSRCRRKAALEVKADKILAALKSDVVAGKLCMMQKSRN